MKRTIKNARQVRFIDQDEPTMLHAGILTPDGDVVCACCGSLYESGERNETWMITHLYYTWVNIEPDVQENNHVEHVLPDEDDSTIRQVLFTHNNESHAGILLDTGDVIFCQDGTILKAEDIKIEGVYQWNDLDEGIAGSELKEMSCFPDDTCGTPRILKTQTPGLKRAQTISYSCPLCGLELWADRLFDGSVVDNRSCYIDHYGSVPGRIIEKKKKPAYCPDCGTKIRWHIIESAVKPLALAMGI